jgi:hypothetical protein
MERPGVLLTHTNHKIEEEALFSLGADAGLGSMIGVISASVIMQSSTKGLMKPMHFMPTLGAS